MRGLTAWLERIDPGTHRRIKGLRLVTAYGIAALLGMLQQRCGGAGATPLASLAAGFALWASVSEARTTRARSSLDLLALTAAASLGAGVMIVLTPLLTGPGRPGPELTLVSGAFLVGYLKRFGVLGAGIGSQIYIGQLLAYGGRLMPSQIGVVGIAGAIAALAAIVPRVLSGPAEHPVAAPAGAAPMAEPGGLSPELSMGLQAAIASLVIVLLNDVVGLEESAWAITACAYVVASSRAGTIERIRRRIVGTSIGVPLGLMFLPIAACVPFVVWLAAALAMIVYAMAIPERYDIACGAYAFTLIATLAVAGEHSVLLLAARAWETLIGGALGLTAALLVVPLRPFRWRS